MYWQVYLHKTVLSAEMLLVKILQRAKELAQNKIKMFVTPAFEFFLYNDIRKKDFDDQIVLNNFMKLDDYDIFTSVKVWAEHNDVVLSTLCKNMVNRKLYKIQLQNNEIDPVQVKNKRDESIKTFNIHPELANYFAFTGTVENNAYTYQGERINILFKDGNVLDIADASDNFNISVLASPVVKHFFCCTPC